MNFVFAEAFAAAQATLGPPDWTNLSQHDQTEAIYREMRRIDLERVFRAPRVDTSAPGVLLLAAE